MEVIQKMDEVDYSYTSQELNEWFGLRSPNFIFGVIATYLLLIYIIVPNYMKNRPPYQLKTYIVAYNSAQMLACIYIINEIFRITSTKIFRFWECSMFESNTLAEYLFNRVTYFTFWLKISELSETIVFALRKKQNQVSYLHVFHHCSTITLVYLLLVNYRGGSALYPLMLNCAVHVIMYAYYLAAAVCDAETLKRLTPVKKSITTIQMIQFVLILLQAAVMSSSCVIAPMVVGYYAFVVIVIFYGFYDFYRKAYDASLKRS
ncbi:PREDICTED: elongation of very long chain fatty acids protein 4 [Rhagoletis zephyria]|uniref:elongation of very long chain fatty acids protein 4 n=1 Tax=Rhagoletis zephyria TaxID=28612 RepID=UPI0008119FFB|nr:PREDICTED: elongation of very long chain fatty acids protein 4 [Rhagoletis zephyria]XP_036332055.1 elongation of very long chain fatty acids protein 4 [Rhagoletis pomonella]